MKSKVRYGLYEIWFPVGSRAALLNAPPKVLLGLGAPGEDGETGLGEGSGHLEDQRGQIIVGMKRKLK